MNTKTEVKKAIKEFRLLLDPIISRLCVHDKCTVREKLTKIDRDLVNLDLFLGRPLWTLYVESMARIERNSYGLDRMRLITKNEKEKIKSCYEVLVEISELHLRVQSSESQ